MAKTVKGYEAKFYVSATPVDTTALDPAVLALAGWVEVCDIKDETDNSEWETVDTSARCDGANGSEELVMKRRPISFSLRYTQDAIPPGAQILNDAHESGATIGVLTVTGDKDVAGNHGFVGNYKVQKMPYNKPLKDVIGRDVELIQAPVVNPGWVIRPIAT